MIDDFIRRIDAINAANRADDDHVSLEHSTRMSAAVVSERRPLDGIPSVLNMVKLARVLGVSLDWLCEMDREEEA